MGGENILGDAGVTQLHKEMTVCFMLLPRPR